MQAQADQFYCNELVVNQGSRPWPAVGIYGARYRFFYDHEDGSGGAEPRSEPDRLRLLELTFQVSSRQHRYELLFNLRGQLIFFREDGAEVGFRAGRPLPGCDRELARRGLRLALQGSQMFRQSLRFQPD